MKSLNQIAAVVSLASFLAAPALAGQGNGNHYGNGGGNGHHYGWSQSSYSYVRSMNFALTQVSARLVRRELTVRFVVDAQSLRFANRSGIYPKLRIETAGQVFEVPIAQVEGFASFTLPRHVEPREMLVSVVGANGRYRIDTVSLDGRVANRVMVPVEKIRDDRPNHGGGNGHHAPAPRWSFQPAVIAACGDAFEGQYNEMECLRVADGFAFNPVDTINTCEYVMEGDANELSCLQTAVRSAVPRIPALNACEVAMEGDANELACFAKATVARFAAKPTIDACEYAFDGDSNELACMDSAFRYAFDPVPVIQSCEASMDGDHAELACLARY